MAAKKKAGRARPKGKAKGSKPKAKAKSTKADPANTSSASLLDATEQHE